MIYKEVEDVPIFASLVPTFGQIVISRTFPKIKYFLRDGSCPNFMSLYFKSARCYASTASQTCGFFYFLKILNDY